MSSDVIEAEESDAFSILGEALESAAERFGDLTAGARDSARSAAHTVQKAVGTGVYKGSYGLSFGLVFGAVFLTELLPEGNTLRRGLTDGAHSGIVSAKSKRISRRAASLGEDLAVDENHGAPTGGGKTKVLSSPALKASPTEKRRAGVK